MADILPTEDNLSERQLKWGRWWLGHKHQVKVVFMIMLAVFGLSTSAYGAWGFLDWFYGSGVKERAEIGRLTENAIDYKAFREAAAPQQVQVEPVFVITAGDDKYDVTSRLTNPNLDWWAEYDYQFNGLGNASRVRHGYILPTESKFLRSLAVKSGSTPAPSLELTNLQWHRVDGHKIGPDYRAWATARTNFRITDVEFVPPEETSQLTVSKAKFKLYNDTAFGYHSITFYIVLRNGSRIVGVNQIVASELVAGERRDIEAVWFNSLPKVTRVEILSEVNIFDDRVYMNPEG